MTILVTADKLDYYDLVGKNWVEQNGPAFCLGPVLRPRADGHRHRSVLQYLF